MSIIDDYKNEWIAKQLEYSKHPREFWMEVIDLVVDGRKKMQADQLSPMGRNWFQDDWLGYLFEIYKRAETIEKEQGMEMALPIYEVCVAEILDNPELYEKLSQWYKEKQWLGDNMRIAKIYLGSSLPPGVTPPKLKTSGFKVTRDAIPKPIDKRNRKT